MQNLKGGKLNLASSYTDASHHVCCWSLVINYKFSSLKEMFNRVTLDCAGEKRALQVPSFHFKYNSHEYT